MKRASAGASDPKENPQTPPPTHKTGVSVGVGHGAGYVQSQTSNYQPGPGWQWPLFEINGQ